MKKIERAIRLLAAWAVVGHVGLAYGAEAAREHIRHIEDHLLPAALVEGEVPETVTLASKMNELGVPGVSIALIHQGHIEWADGVGVTRLGGRPVDKDTVFQAASVSKPVTAMAVMALVQAGKLDLDRDVNEYLSSWKVPVGPANATERVTLRRLLSHTAGTTVHGFDGYVPGEPVPSLIQVLNGEKPANSAPVRVDTVPGSLWSYSGGGYEIIQQLLYDITRTPFAQLMDNSVLRPAGMRRSSFEQPVASRLRQDAATPYDANGRPIVGGAHVYPEQAAAGLWTTPSDLALLALDLQRSLAGNHGGILAPATAHEMLSPAGKGSWGLGYEVGNLDDHPYFTHGGSNEGFRCLLVAFERGDGIVVMTNGERGATIAAALRRTAAAEYGWPQFQPKHHHVVHLPTASLDRFAGRYRVNSGESIAIIRKDERLYFQPEGQEAGEIIADGPASFFSKTREIQVLFRQDPSGQVSGLGIVAGNTTSEAGRVE
jgi:CubicO group peptidase (beta-lactamase class C family)